MFQRRLEGGKKNHVHLPPLFYLHTGLASIICFINRACTEACRIALSSGTAEGRHDDDGARARGPRAAREVPGPRAGRSLWLRGRCAGRKCGGGGGRGVSGCGARFRPVRRRPPAAKESSAASPASTLRTPLAPRASISSHLAVGRDDMSSKEGGVFSGPGRYLFKGGGSPSFLSHFPLLFTLEGCPLPIQARGAVAPVISRPYRSSLHPFLFLNPRAVFLNLSSVIAPPCARSGKPLVEARVR